MMTFTATIDALEAEIGEIADVTHTHDTRLDQ